VRTLASPDDAPAVLPSNLHGYLAREPMPQQTLQTDRITLVPLADEHFEWEVELDSDLAVMRYLSGRASTREEVVASHARRMAAAQNVDGLGFWVGLVDDEFVGWWILQRAHGPDQPDDPGVADLGYRLLPRHWRKGLASEGARELVRYGFEDVGLDRIIAQAMTVNTGSRAVMERVGLTYVRTFPTSTTAPVEGIEEGEVEYEMTREQWERGQLAELARPMVEPSRPPMPRSAGSR
jgi:RimJ/RimL family protein N-acetyltransferase